ncbi:MAG: hypothetical protein HQL63_06000 [Magnetococcales bacterium]|nr:hypothetical protein [Magnetococcales bacterium]MBF0321578.1 hypothetical protein [Magnetococcales bacterium]
MASKSNKSCSTPELGCDRTSEKKVNVSPRVALRLLSLQSTGMDATCAVSTGWMWRWSDVSWALARVNNRTASLFLRVKYGGQERFLSDLVWWAGMEAREFFATKGWQYRSATTVQKLAEMAVLDKLAPRLCKLCKGVDRPVEKGILFFANDPEPAVCRECQGTGLGRPPSSRARARQLEISQAQWRYRWGFRFHSFSEHLEELEHVALQIIYQAMSES